MPVTFKHLLKRHSDPSVLPLDLDRDYPEIERLLVAEDWPFVRGDVEVSHGQPVAPAYVARSDDRLAGFFLTHAFGRVGYLDMMIVDPDFRNFTVAKALYFNVMRDFQRHGISSLVCHTTKASATIVRFLGFRPGWDFTLVTREAGRMEHRNGRHSPQLEEIDTGDRDALLALDASVFGRSRATWIESLFAQPDSQFFGLFRKDRLVASACLRPRRNGAACLDSVNSESDADLAALVNALVTEPSDRRLECFVRTGSPLHGLLTARGFTVPGFFTEIGPLVEWRRGECGTVGLSPRLQCLCWF